MSPIPLALSILLLALFFVLGVSAGYLLAVWCAYGKRR